MKRIAWSPDGKWLASSSDDRTVRLWDGDGGRPLAVLSGHADTVYGLAWSPDGRALASASADCSVRFWDATTGKLLDRLDGHTDLVTSVAFSPDGRLLASGSDDCTVRLCERSAAGAHRTLVGAPGMIQGVVWSPDSREMYASAGSVIACWQVETGEKLPAFEGHDGYVFGLALSPDGRTLASSASDGTIRLWDRTGRQTLLVLEGHTGSVTSVSFSADGRFLASKSRDDTVCLWGLPRGERLAVLAEPHSQRTTSGLAFHPRDLLLATLGDEEMIIRAWDLDAAALPRPGRQTRTTHYANAKVVLVGDSGVGKSGLALVLSGQDFAPTESTHGRQVRLVEAVEADLGDGQVESRETLLWDLAGQPGYRVFHRQHLDDAAVALVLFDAHSETDPFAGVAYWAAAIDEATRARPAVKFLVVARCDRGAPAVSDERVRRLCSRHGFAGYFQTSARRGDGVAELRRAVREAVPWDRLPRVSTPQLFASMKAFAVGEKAAGRVLQRQSEMLERFRSAHPAEGAAEEGFAACLGRLEAAGLVKRLTFGGHVLLQPELLDEYGAWLAQAARAQRDGLGFLPERQARDGRFPMDQGRPLNGKPEEALLITATVEDVVGRGIALRQPTEQGEMLVFPSELRADMPDEPGGLQREVAFRFAGPVRAVYATLAVCLAHAPAFARVRFYRDAAVFRGIDGGLCGIAADHPDPADETHGRLTVLFDAAAGRAAKLTCLRYVHRQLEAMAYGGQVQRERVYQCPCGYVIPPAAIERRRGRGDKTALCPVCEGQMPLDDLAERSADDDGAVREQMERTAEERERQRRAVVLPERERGREYHVFLCHNHLDKPEVRQLAERLRRQSLLPWIDEEGIVGGQFSSELERVLEETPAAAVLLGGHGMGNWQHQEYTSLFGRYVEQRGGKGRRLALVPVYLPSAAADPVVPMFLRTFDWIDFRQPGGFDNEAAMRRLVRAVLAGELTG